LKSLRLAANDRPTGPLGDDIMIKGFKTASRAVLAAAMLGAGALAGLAATAPAAQADQVINDDLIVAFSLCVGTDCNNGESFGFDTIRLKENNLRIRFLDTSSSASFPTVDWQLTANDSANGGLNHFSIESLDNSAVPFRVEYGAPSNSLRIDQFGNVGIGTNNPIVELHVTDGDTPTLRLEQDGSSGFAAQTWDVAGNETNFFVRDATSGSALPFRIRAGAPNNALYIAENGDVGIGTNSPDENLTIAGSVNRRTAIELQSIDSPDHFQIIWNGEETRFSNENAPTVALTLLPTGDATFAGGLTTASTCLQMDTLACTFTDGAGASCSVGTCP
jgi:hypothetical protein